MKQEKKKSTKYPFPKSVRVLKQADFDRVYRGDVFAADEVLVIKGAANDLDRIRLGLSISRKVGNAVVRNRWKRVIREAFRLQRPQLPTGLDVVVRPRKGASCEYDAVFRSLRQLIGKLDRRVKKPVSKQRGSK